MRKLIFTLIIGCIISTVIHAQNKLYSVTGFEMILSGASINYKGETGGNVIRWAPVINIQGFLNYDIGKKFGLFSGLGFRNVGYIINNYIDLENNKVKKKFRTYNFGIPIGIKIGNLKELFVYVGYDFEFPFHYKEKTFKDDVKTITVKTFFSRRVELFQQALIVGIQFPSSLNLKFKYYLSDFNNVNYTESNGYMPYSGLHANVLYISLNFALFRNARFYYDDE